MEICLLQPTAVQNSQNVIFTQWNNFRLFEQILMTFIESGTVCDPSGPNYISSGVWSDVQSAARD